MKIFEQFKFVRVRLGVKVLHILAKKKEDKNMLKSLKHSGIKLLVILISKTFGGYL